MLVLPMHIRIEASPPLPPAAGSPNTVSIRPSILTPQARKGLRRLVSYDGTMTVPVPNAPRTGPRLLSSLSRRVYR